MPLIMAIPRQAQDQIPSRLIVQFCKLNQMNQRFIAILIVLLFVQAHSLNHSIKTLKDNWKMQIVSCPGAFQSFSNKEFNVTVPSTLHLNLEKHNQIPNPYFGENLKALNMLSECEVKFITTISIQEQLSQYSKINLVFNGIDTYSSVYLNDALLGKTQNAFLKYEYQVKDHLKKGNNLVVVHIKSPKPIDTLGQQRDRMPFDYAHTRKACYQYSWDWAPYMNTLGIWLPVDLILYDQAKIDYIWVRIEKLTPQVAMLDFVIALDGVKSDENLTPKGLTVRIMRVDNKEVRQYMVKAKFNNAKLNISQPRLWWPNNIGQPHVYQFNVYLMRGNQVLSQKRVVYGLRTVKLNHEGTNFQIILNGHPVYCKGANYVPLDMMYPRLINPDFKSPYSFKQLLSDAAASNFNMVRVWGGGQYESDQFYELAARKGIMIFQDFMFSDSIYPGTDQFLENVSKEIVYQVRRLRNYPCIVLWSGNNQILQGINSWGWGQPRYRDNYNKLFGKIIPDILQIQSGNLPYIESSPSRGVGNGGFQQGGDIHYWGVWAAGSPFESYETALGGFNSQFGTQSLPVWQTIKDFTLPNDRMYQSDKMLFHEKHNSRFNTLRSYMTRYAKKSSNFELEAYNSGLLHAYAMEIAIRAQRIAKPKSYGTLYWMLNDAWPAISWSSIDYYGRWKAVQYYAKNLYRDIILFYHPVKNNFVAVNDKLYTVKANYKIEVMMFSGKVIYEDSGVLELKENQNRVLHALERKIVAGKENGVLVYTEIVYGIGPENRTSLVTFLKPLKDLNLQPAEVIVHFLYGTNEMIVWSDNLVKSLYISSSKQYIKLTDNYFDLVPKKKRTIGILNPDVSLQDLKPSLVFRSYREVSEAAPLKVNFEN